MVAYYNENDPAAAHILRALIDDGVVAPGHVDTRSIKEVMPDDLEGYTQCHFFAGGGLWSVAARLAGWPDTRPLWTGSCPCQPFSGAGKGLGADDPRHLWPDFHRLISARRPAVVMGEQVAGKAGYGWFDGVGADLAGEDYASRAVDFPACSVDAPHQRNRLYWIAVGQPESVRRGARRAKHEILGGWPTPASADARSPLGDNDGVGRAEAVGESGNHKAPDCGGEASGIERPYGGDSIHVADRSSQPGQQVTGGALGDEATNGREGRDGFEPDGHHGHICDDEGRGVSRNLQRNGTYWSGAEWIACHDGKARRAEPDICFLVDGLPGRVDLWRVGGNAIVPPAAAEVIAAFMDTEHQNATHVSGAAA